FKVVESRPAGEEHVRYAQSHPPLDPGELPGYSRLRRYLSGWDRIKQTMKPIRIGRTGCADLESACKLEWLETNGIGGFASSSILGWNTRRYHGLLIAAIKPPVGRVVMLSKLEETLVIGGQRFELGTNRYPGVVHPQGYRYLREFRVDPFPTWTFDVGGVI